VGDPVLTVSGLVKRYDGRVVVDGLDLAAGYGQVTAILGPNGAGKTTTMEICEGLRQADAGTVQVLGHRPGSAAVRPQVGVMLQEVGVYGSVTGHEALRHAQALFADPQPVADLMEALGLAAVAQTPFRRMSGGEKQRLGVALALVGRPRLVFLDEPTAGLDPQARRTVWEILRRLGSAEVSVIMTTHYLEEVEQLADHVVIIDNGAVLASGSPTEIVTTVMPPTIRFTAPPALDLSLLRTALGASASVVEERPGSYVVSTEDSANSDSVTSSASLTAVTTWLAQNQVVATSLNTGSRNLEDAYLHLTGRELRP
jgi:ABC-2 type transport system ATP-binding protein